MDCSRCLGSIREKAARQLNAKYLHVCERSPSISSEKTSLNFPPSFPLHNPPIDLRVVISSKDLEFQPDARVEEDSFQHRSQLVLRFALWVRCSLKRKQYSCLGLTFVTLLHVSSKMERWQSKMLRNPRMMFLSELSAKFCQKKLLFNQKIFWFVKNLGIVMVGLFRIS